MSSAFMQIAKLKIVNALYNPKSARCAQHRAAQKNPPVFLCLTRNPGVYLFHSSIYLFLLSPVHINQSSISSPSKLGIRLYRVKVYLIIKQVYLVIKSYLHNHRQPTPFNGIEGFIPLYQLSVKNTAFPLTFSVLTAPLSSSPFIAERTFAVVRSAHSGNSRTISSRVNLRVGSAVM